MFMSVDMFAIAILVAVALPSFEIGSIAVRCEGWLQTSYLAAANEDEMPVAIQRRAVLIDSCRSFLTLELPSLCGACG